MPLLRHATPLMDFDLDSSSMTGSTNATTIIVEDSDGTSFPEPSNSRESLPSYLKGKNPDFVLVWNECDKAATTRDAFRKRSIFECNLEEEGLILEWENADSDPHLHAVKIWATLEVLIRYSEVLKVKLPMKPVEDEDEKHSQSGQTRYLTLKGSLSAITEFHRSFWNFFGRCLSLQLDPSVFPPQCRRLTGVYSRDKDYLFDVDETNMYEIYPLSMRSRIVQYILRRKPYKVGEDLDRDDFAFGYERLIQKRIYNAGYPLHDGKYSEIQHESGSKHSTRRNLVEHWAKLSLLLKFQPLDSVKDYFGVNIALYFAWLGYYTRMLSVAALLGVIMLVFGAITINHDQYVLDVCNSTADVVMCPLCDHSCGYWQLRDRCQFSKLAHLFDNDLTVAFALLMSVWTAFFLEFWKRYSARITFRWDLTSFDVRDFTPRPEYVAELKKSFPMRNTKDGQPADFDKRKMFDFDLNIPFWKKRMPFRLLSYSTVILMVVLVLSSVLGVIMYRLWFTYILFKGRPIGRDIAWERLVVAFSGALLNLSFIFVFGKFYERLALRLTEMEMPRTQSEFDASFIIKLYLIQFINNYSSVFYIAFFKGAYTGHPQKYHKVFGVFRQEECGVSCMPELCIQLVVIMVGKQAKSIFMEAMLPWIRRNIKRIHGRLKLSRSNANAGRDDLSDTSSINASVYQWVDDYDLLDCGHFMLTDEYLEMTLQFGFVTIFVTAFPLTPLFALINNLLQLRIDAIKMLRHYRRPVGLRVKDIGVWANIVDGVVKLSTLSNACIIALSSNFIPKMMYRYVLLDPDDPNFGTLRGYINHTLTVYDTDDLEIKPDTNVLAVDAISEICHFPTYRNDYNVHPKYEYRTVHWQIWLARVIFIIVYENVVTILVNTLRWIIPDKPSSLLRQMQHEQRLVNELILKHELARDQRIHNYSMKTRVSTPPDGQSKTTGVNLDTDFYMPAAAAPEKPKRKAE